MIDGGSRLKCQVSSEEWDSEAVHTQQGHSTLRLWPNQAKQWENGHQKAEDATKDRLTRKLGAEPEIRALIGEILEGKREAQNNNLSLTQACEKSWKKEYPRTNVQRRKTLGGVQRSARVCMGQDNPFNMIEMGNEAKTVDHNSKKKVVRKSITKKGKV